MDQRHAFAAGSRVLVIRWNAIGDLLLATPVLRALKESIPGCRITLLAGTRNADVARRLPDVDDVEVFDVYDLFAGVRRIGEQLRYALSQRSNRYSLIVDLGTARAAWFARLCGAPVRVGINRSQSIRRWCYTDGEFQSDSHAVQELMRPVRDVGVDTSDLGLGMYAIYPEEEKFAAEYFSTVDADLTIGLNIGAANAERRWPVKRFAELGLALQACYPHCRIWVNTTVSEQSLRDEYHAVAGTRRTLYSPPLTIGQLGALISRCDLLVTNDTAPMHIGIASRVRTLGIFGPNPVEFLSPLDSRPFKGVRGWPMDSLQVDNVLAVAREWLGNTR